MSGVQFMSEANATSDSVGRDRWLWLSPRVLKFRNRYGVNKFAVWKNLELVSSPGESHPKALAEPDVNVSAHTTPIIQPRKTALT